MGHLKDEEKLLITAEVDAWINHKRKEKQLRENFQPVSHLQIPTQVSIPKLLITPFINEVTQSLELRIKKLSPK